MSIATLVIGESGTGKSTSLRNMNPAETLLIQTIKKPLPFKSPNWKRHGAGQAGNVMTTDDCGSIIKIMQKTQRKIIVLDDFQYMMANEFMRRSDEKGFQKFTDIGKHAHTILTLASNLPDDVRVYILSHSDTTDTGNTKCKTIGKLLDEKITVEGLFTIVLRTGVEDGNFFFLTQNSGSDTVKSPMGLFDTPRIDNDLDQVDKAIVNYYEIGANQ